MEERGYVSLRYRSSHERTEEAQLDSIDPSTCLEFLSPREQRAEEAKRRRQGLFWRIERHVSTRLTGKIGSKRLIKILRFFLFHFQPPTTNDFLKIGEILINPWKNGKSIQIIQSSTKKGKLSYREDKGELEKLQLCINDYTFPSFLGDVTDKRSLRVSKILTNILHYSWRPSPPRATRKCQFHPSSACVSRKLISKSFISRHPATSTRPDFATPSFRQSRQTYIFCNSISFINFKRNYILINYLKQVFINKKSNFLFASISNWICLKFSKFPSTLQKFT